jgi:serine/threonine protein kinase/formylglycine-generating enzyme required for sulfatase activity
VTSESNTDFDDLSDKQMLVINDVCNRFEQLWQSGDVPDLAAFLQDSAPPVSDALIRCLVEIDVAYRIGSDQAIDVDGYSSCFPLADQQWLKQLIEDVISESADSSSTLSPELDLSDEAAAAGISCDQALDRISQTGLLAEKHLAELRLRFADRAGDDSAELMQDLIDSERLTRFQCQVVWGRSGDPLVLGDYVLLDRIGQGGMGTVYRAMHRRMKRIVAVKVLRDDPSRSDDMARRFLREVEVAARLSHANIVTAYDAGEQDGLSYLVTEFVDGQDLGQFIQENGPLALPDAVDLVLQAAKGLQYAHNEGVIHRDIKPSNLLLDDSGGIKLLDVGLARVNVNRLSDEEAVPDLTTTGMMMGTIDYMSPEQAQNTRLADERSDIYSLGCTLHYLLTGAAPFASGTAMERLIAHREQPIPSLRSLSGQVPAEVDEVLKQMLAKSPGDRFQNMTQVVDALERVLKSDLPEIVLEPGLPTGTTAVHADAQTEEQPDATVLKEGAGTEDVVDVEDSNDFRFGSQVSLSPDDINAAAVTQVAISPGRQRATARKSSAAGIPWLSVLLPGIAAVALVAWWFGPDNSAQQSDLPDITDIPPAPTIELLAEVSEAEAVEYRSRWAAHLAVPEREVLAGIGFQFIPAGRFLMGPPESQTEQTVDQGWYLSDTEITVAQFRRFIEARPDYTPVAHEPGSPGGFGLNAATGEWERRPEFGWKNLGDNQFSEQLPAVSMAFADAQAFCRWMSETTGRTVRLPTEIEWEYACRCGRQGSWCFGDDSSRLSQYAWVAVNSDSQIHNVALLQPNIWGLFDMHGNESEWCLPDEQQTSGELAAVRGGNFASTASGCTSYTRQEQPRWQVTHGAFRVLMELPTE